MSAEERSRPAAAGAPVPEWLRTAVDAVVAAPTGAFSPLPAAADPTARPSAVLLLFGEVDGVADLLLTERAAGLRSHAGQAAFPGGAIDADDDGPVAAALREAEEETGLDPTCVDILGVLPPLWIPVTNYLVTPVLGWWREPCEVRVVDASEVASVHRVPLDQLLDPAHRLQVRHHSGFVSPAFRADALLVWGFTAGVLDRLFSLSGWEKPWDRDRVVPLPGGGRKGGESP